MQVSQEKHAHRETITRIVHKPSNHPEVIEEVSKTRN